MEATCGFNGSIHGLGHAVEDKDSVSCFPSQVCLRLPLASIGWLSLVEQVIWKLGNSFDHTGRDPAPWVRLWRLRHTLPFWTAVRLSL